MLNISIPFKLDLHICHRLQRYHQTSNISHRLVGNKLIDHSDVVGAEPAPITSPFHIQHLDAMDWAKTNCEMRRETY